jgi:hypothetical protein
MRFNLVQGLTCRDLHGRQLSELIAQEVFMRIRFTEMREFEGLEIVPEIAKF